MKKLSLLGSTGSIGLQAIDVVRMLKNAGDDSYSIAGLAAYSNIELLENQIREFKPQAVAVFDLESAKNLKYNVKDLDVKVLSGMDGLCEVASLYSADVVLNSVTGMVGLLPTLSAIDAGKTLALANKESLVTGGALVMEAAKNKNVSILPVDSEHSAIFQCLQGSVSPKQLKKLIITASGGPFFGKTIDELKRVTPEMALKHPNWDMGARITIDSATMFNKGLEIMEAKWLFNMEPEDIDVVVHRESVVHSLIEYVDNSVIAQLGVPDMRIPIQYALTWPERCAGNAPALDFKTLGTLTFDEADENTFRCLAACKKAIRKGGLAPCAANGANEEAVRLFLADEISFLSIGRLVEAVVDSEEFGGAYTLADVYACDQKARAFVQAHKND